jgi:hypothetical protein
MAAAAAAAAADVESAGKPAKVVLQNYKAKLNEGCGPTTAPFVFNDHSTLITTEWSGIIVRSSNGISRCSAHDRSQLKNKITGICQNSAKGRIASFLISVEIS